MTPANYISLAALAISLIMMLVNVVNITKSQSRADQSEREKDEPAQQTSIMLALDNIKRSLTRIENEINTVRQDARENHDKLIMLEQSAKAEHKRLDRHDERLNAIEAVLRETHKT